MKRHVWIVEKRGKGVEWVAVDLGWSRENARTFAAFYRKDGEKVRVVKYVPERKER